MASVDTVNASSSSSSSLPFNNVFLSFRGSDTCNNFIDQLPKGIFTFRDAKRFERGKSIAKELLIAKFAVVILSRNYASSRWCLAEVAKIVECMKKKKLIVLPIFHYVDPSDVRHQTGAFADAFAEHEECFKDSTEVVSLWRDALTKVANMVGWVLNYGDPDSQLIHEIIKSLSNWMPEDGSTNWNSPPRFDVTPDESDDADDDADEMVQDNVADLPLIGQENESLPNLSNGQVQLITNFVESLSIGMPEDGSTNWNSPPRFDVTPDESDDADDDADEMVQDNVADLPLIGQENESLPNLSNGQVQLITNFVESLSIGMPEDGSTNWNSPPRFDVTPDESDDADEMVQDNVADLPLELPPRYDDYIDDAVDVMQEAHVVPDDVADAPQEAHVVPDDVANVPQEAHEVGDHAANSQRLCPICDNAIGVAFCCGHQFCVECGYRCSTCPICRDRVHIRLRLY